MSLVRSQLVSLEFFIDIKSFRSHYGPGVDSASNRNEYQEYFLWGKGGRCVRLTTYHHPVPLSRNLGTLTSWNPLGHSRPVTRLRFTYLQTHTSMCKGLIEGRTVGLEDRQEKVKLYITCHEGIQQKWRQTPLDINLSTRTKRLVCTTPWTLFQGKTASGIP